MVTVTARALVKAAPSDGELARAARAGDVASLGELLERYRAPLHAVALRLLGHDDADDAVQETFVIALRRIGEVRDPDAVGGWLHAVLRNVCLMSVRRQRPVALSGSRLIAEDISDAQQSVEEVVDGLALRDWVWAALSALPAHLQATAMLRWFGRYSSYAEIAAILGVPVGTVRSRLSEAKRRLAEALLESAGLAHDQARRARDRGVALYGGAFDDIVRWEAFIRTFSEDVVVVRARGDEVRGRRSVIPVVTAYPEAGVELHPTRVLASERVTVLEGRFEPAAAHPYQCPPETSQVHFHRPDGLTDRVYLYYGARPRAEE
jgi:RNA polymerase sigma factor (sigma-70 family)